MSSVRYVVYYRAMLTYADVTAMLTYAEYIICLSMSSVGYVDELCSLLQSYADVCLRQPAYARMLTYADISLHTQ